MNYEGEIWKAIEGYNGKYQISSKGRVRSFVRKGGGRIMSPGTSTGYYYFNLSSPHGPKNEKAHRLVAKAFIANIDNKPEVNHIDGNKKNNVVSNLEWCTKLENMKHAISIGRVQQGCDAHKSKLSKSDVIAIRQDKRLLREIAQDYSVCMSTVSFVKGGRHYKLIP